MRAKQMKDLKFKMKTWISNFFYVSQDIFRLFYFFASASSHLKLKAIVWLKIWNYFLRYMLIASHVYFSLTWDPSELEKVHTYLIELTRKPRWNVAIHHFNVNKRFSSIRKFACNPNKNAKVVYRLPISVLLNIYRPHIGRFLKSKFTEHKTPIHVFRLLKSLFENLEHILLSKVHHGF